MTIRRQLLMFAFGLMILGPGTIARAQPGEESAAGTGVQPRHLIPCGRIISLRDADSDEPRGCAAPASCVAPPQCSAGPSCAASCEVEPCESCRRSCGGRLRTAWDRFVQQIFACPQCACPEPCCAAPPTCVTRPTCGCDLPYLPRGIVPATPRTEGNPFRDDSVEPPLAPKGAAYRSHQPSLSAEPAPVKAGAARPTLAPPRAETIKPRVALNSPRVQVDE